jgi:hypothetical protein
MLNIILSKMWFKKCKKCFLPTQMQYFAVVLLWWDTDYKKLFYLAGEYVSRLLTI